MNIIRYIKVFGNLSFEEKPFNDVDALIFAQLSYLNFDLVAPLINETDKSPFFLRDLDPSLAPSLSKGEIDTKRNHKMILEMVKSKRFKDCSICFVSRTSNVDEEEQFFAITIVMPNKEKYISYRGTDGTLLGWKEDFNMALLDQIPAQKEAKEYLACVTQLFNENFYIGGHSKGGNLAFYATMSLSFLDEPRLIKSYSFDGPGFKDKDFFNNARYTRLKDRMYKFVPQDSLVGILLNNCEEPNVVMSNAISVIQHDPFSWIIDDNGDFKVKHRRTLTSHINEMAFFEWINSLTPDDISLTTEALFMFLGGKENDIFTLINHPGKSIKNFVNSYKGFSGENKKKIAKNMLKLLSFYKKAISFHWLKFKSKLTGNKIVKESE